jgi:hypothetical protein
MRIIRRDAVGKFMHVELAQNHSARRFQALDNRRIEIGQQIFENLGAGSSAHSAHGEQILNGDGNAMQRPAIAPGSEFGFGLARAHHRIFGCDCDECVELRIEALDARDGSPG